MRRQSIARKERKWKRLVTRWEQSGKTQRDFCAAQGIGYWTFHRWRKRLSGARAEPTQSNSAPATTPHHPFIALRAVRVPDGGRPAACVRFESGVLIEFAELPDAAFLQGLATIKLAA